jgi:hypothetical protein
LKRERLVSSIPKTAAESHFPRKIEKTPEAKRITIPKGIANATNQNMLTKPDMSPVKAGAEHFVM